MRVTTFVRSDSAGNICLYTTSRAQVTFDKRLVTPVMAIHKPVTRLDTTNPRDGGAPTVAGKLRRIPTGVWNKTAVGTLTVSEATAPGFAAVVPCASGWRDTNTVSYDPGEVVSNTAVVQADAQGDICVFTSTSVHLRWDQVAETITIPNAAPKRVFDTRSPSFFGGVPFPAWQAGSFLKVEPNRSVFGNVTVLQPEADGFLTVFPCTGAPQPTNATIAFKKGQRMAAFVATTADANGNVCVFSTARTHVLWDTAATSTWYQVGAPVRIFPAG
jgi:hypothetical protein